MIQRKKKICKGCDTEQYLFSKGYCQRCAPKKQIKKQNKNAKRNQDFYNKALLESEGKRCEECDCEIPFPSATNVSHIVTKGSNSFVRSHPLNYFYLCHGCHFNYDHGDRASMRIYDEALRRKQIITREYYDEVLSKDIRRKPDDQVS
jgi:uncharacterized protein with PIN domain